MGDHCGNGTTPPVGVEETTEKEGGVKLMKICKGELERRAGCARGQKKWAWKGRSKLFNRAPGRRGFQRRPTKKKIGR